MMWCEESDTTRTEGEAPSSVLMGQVRVRVRACAGMGVHAVACTRLPGLVAFVAGRACSAVLGPALRLRMPAILCCHGVR